MFNKSTVGLWLLVCLVIAAVQVESQVLETEENGLTCDTVLCKTGSFCVMEGDHPVCSQSEEEEDVKQSPTCASTLCLTGSTCIMEDGRPVCRSNKLSCDNVRCQDGRTCVIKNGRPICECKSACPRIYKPVCGTNGKDYSNSCELEAAACRLNKQIKVAKEGKCRGD